MIENLNILELSNVLAGPAVGMFFSELGANVIKVERPVSGDDSRNLGPPYLDSNSTDPKESAYFLSVNRNKSSVTIDLTKKEGQELAKKIINHVHLSLKNLLNQTYQDLR